MSEFHASPQKRDTILYLDGVSVSFDGFKALNNLSFYVLAGELRAVIGPNGAGKTTMMDVVTGKTRPDSGQVVFNGGVDLTALDEARIANLGIGRKFQKPTVFATQSVFDNLELALAGSRGVFQSLGFRLTPEQRVASTRCWKPLDSPNGAPPWPATCRMARSSGWRSACS